VGDELPAWTQGTLDIHQIQTGRGNAAFVVFPDGSTLLIDAGSVPYRPGPQLAAARPNGSRTPAEWIARYIEQFGPQQSAPHPPVTLDYVLITHYHDDHMGAIAALGNLIRVGKLIDRGDEPAPGPSPLMDTYRTFRQSVGDRHAVLRIGRNDQIVARWPDVEVRNLAGNGEVWTGSGDTTRQVFPTGWNRLPVTEQPTENELSLALRIRYGRFRYYTGGDLAGVPLDGLPDWHDVETPVAQAVGPVDVAVLNHHGWLDSTNAFFLASLQPRVVIIPAWHATHPDHGVLRRLLATRIYPGPRDLFATTLLDAPRTIFSYLGDPFKSTHGHIVVRVAKAGASYSVFILEDGDDRRRVIAVHGPYQPK
jgi:glyoxylase-like metal-dependent hydrolase (beta-lactamase superfamily II)